VLVVLAVVLAAAVAKPVTAAAGPIARVVAEIVTVALIAVASLAGLAVLAGLALVAVRVRRRILSGPRAVPRRMTAEVLDSREAAELAERDRRALPAARNDASAYPRVHASPYVVTSRAPRPRCPHRGGKWS
jgi:hypothetical protein